MRYTKMVNIAGQDIFEQYGHTRQFRAGQVITECGARANRLFFIQKGQVRAFLSSPDGREITLFYIGAGNLCCLESMVSHPQYIMNVEAASDLIASSIDPDVFLREWAARGYSVKDLLSHFVRRVLLLSDYLCGMRFNQSIVRVAYFLYSACEGCRTAVYFTHEEIAELVGTSRITVDRCLKTLETDGAIRCEYHKIKVTNEEKLLKHFSSLELGLA